MLQLGSLFNIIISSYIFTLINIVQRISCIYCVVLYKLRFLNVYGIRSITTKEMKPIKLIKRDIV